MSSWLFFALSGPLLWAFTNVFDGALRRNFIRDDLSLTWLTAICRLPFVALFFLISGLSFPNAPVFFGMIIAGMLWTSPMFFYYKALKEDDPSRIALLLQLVPIFTLPIAFFVIGERLVGFQVLAFVSLIFAGIFASLKKMYGKWKLSRALFLMALSCFVWAISDVLFKKFAPFFPDYMSAFSVDFLGGFLICFFLFLMPKNKKKVLESLKGLSLKAWLIVFSSVSFGIAGGLSYNYALTLGKASLTSVLMGTQPLFVLIIGLFFAHVSGFLKEDMRKSSLILKATSFVFLVIGLILLQI